MSARFTVVMNATGGGQIERIFQTSAGESVFITTRPAGSSDLGSNQQCTGLTATGAPEWYAGSSCTIIDPKI